MIVREIGKYRSYVLEQDDMVVVMGEVKRSRELLEGLGFEDHLETGEWTGAGAGLYAMSPEVFFDLFGGRNGGEPELAAQATDGEAFYRVDALPLVGEDAGGNAVIDRITALDMETRAFIEEGVSNFRVG